MSNFRRLAKEAGIWLSLGGFQEVGPDPDHIYNTHAILSSDGTIMASYRKVMATQQGLLANIWRWIAGLFINKCLAY